MRAIDGDELWEKMYRYSDNEGAKMPYGDDDSLIHKDSACSLIENAPTIEPEPHWIPCNERLPEKTGWYAVIDDSGGAKFVETSYYREEDGLDPFWEFVNPVAWMSMELPKPYREGE